MSLFTVKPLSESIQRDFRELFEMQKRSVTGPGWKNVMNFVNMLLTSKGIDYKDKMLNLALKFGEKGRARLDHDVALIKEKLAEVGIKLLCTEDGYCAYTDESVIGSLHVSIGVTDIVIRLQGMDTYVDCAQKIIEENFNTKGAPRCWRFGLDNQKMLQMSEIPLSVPEKITGLRDFYPSVKKSPEQMADEFIASSANVLFLIGDPGLGKSTYVLSMLNHLGWENRRYYLIDSDIVLKHDQLIDRIRELPAGSILIIEDADRFVGTREGGNDQMSGLLNISSGIATSGVKIVISTNLSGVNKVDQALIRPGRCHEVLKFELLDAQQANDARAVLDLEPVEFTADKLSLSQALNNADTSNRTKQYGFQPAA